MVYSAYIVIFVVLSISLFIGLSLSFLSNVLIKKNKDFEKLSAYECGFDPFSDTYVPFDVHYYIVSLLFIIFDIEVVFLFPWSVSFLYINLTGFFAMLIFLLILTLGFIYEWFVGALDWL